MSSSNNNQQKLVKAVKQLQDRVANLERRLERLDPTRSGKNFDKPEDYEIQKEMKHGENIRRLEKLTERYEQGGSKDKRLGDQIQRLQEEVDSSKRDSDQKEFSNLVRQTGLEKAPKAEKLKLWKIYSTVGPSDESFMTLLMQLRREYDDLERPQEETEHARKIRETNRK